MDSDTTVREQICEHLKARFEDQRKGSNNARITWHIVSREPLTKDQQEEGFAVGLYDTTERGTEEIGWQHTFLNFLSQARVKVLDGDKPSVVLAEALG